jgi:hypothetical protein
MDGYPATERPQVVLVIDGEVQLPAREVCAVCGLELPAGESSRLGLMIPGEAPCASDFRRRERCLFEPAISRYRRSWVDEFLQGIAEEGKPLAQPGDASLLDAEIDSRLAVQLGEALIENERLKALIRLMCPPLATADGGLLVGMRAVYEENTGENRTPDHGWIDGSIILEATKTVAGRGTGDTN